MEAANVKTQPLVLDPFFSGAVICEEEELSSSSVARRKFVNGSSQNFPIIDFLLSFVSRLETFRFI